MCKLWKVWFVEQITQTCFCGYVIAESRFSAMIGGERLASSIWNLCRRSFGIFSVSEYEWRTSSEIERRAEYEGLKASEREYLRKILP